MNGNILDNVTKVAGNISPFSVILLIIITIVGVVLLITLCNGGLIAMKKLWHKLFDKTDKHGGNEL